MRLLDRPRPQVHHRQLIVLAVPGKDFLGAPGFLHQLQRLAVTLALLDRHDAVGDRRVGRQSGRKARDQTAAADAVDHGVFFGDPRRRAGRGQGRAELHDRHVHAVGGARQHRAHQARIGHETVDVLVVLVGAHPVHARARRVDELVERPVVILAHLLRIGDVEPDRIDVSGLVMLVEIRRQIAIRHQVEHADFHGGPFKFLDCGRPADAGFAVIVGDFADRPQQPVRRIRRPRRSSGRSGTAIDAVQFSSGNGMRVGLIGWNCARNAIALRSTNSTRRSLTVIMPLSRAAAPGCD